MITREDLIWIAEILDLKGHAFAKVNPKRATYQYILMFDTANQEIIDRACQLTGIKAEPHCRVHRWLVSGAGMVVVVDNLEPYLNRDFALITEAARQQTVLSGRGSGAVRKSLLRLRNLGWRLPDDFEAAIVKDIERREWFNGQDQQQVSED